jgi:hypothetical protein
MVFSTQSSLALALSGALFSGAQSADPKSDIGFLLAATVMGGFAAAAGLRLARRAQHLRTSKRVFVMYSHHDKAAAAHIAEILRNAGFDPWIDVEQLLPGQVWRKEIDRAIGDSGAVIVLVSSHLQTGRFVREDLAAVLRQARSRGTSTIVPILLDDTTPPEELADIQWVDLRIPGANDRLLRGLAAITHSDLEPHRGAVREIA